MELIEKTVKSSTVFKGKIFTVRFDEAILPNGKPCFREIVEHDGGVCIAPVTDNNELVFVKQFRYAYSKVLLELPAGKLENNEDPLVAGIRELEEETGYIAEKYVDCGEFYPSPGYCGEVIHLYAAKNLKSTAMNLDEDEFLEVEHIPVEKAVEMVLNNEIVDGKTQALVLKVAAYIENGVL